jgi:sugar/nucleoside kinase (ribokinase family)
MEAVLRFNVVQVDELPPEDVQARERLLSSLTAEPPSQDLWQVGGNTNFMIAAARLGLNVTCCGYVGDDIFGHYLLKCLRVRPLNSRIRPASCVKSWDLSFGMH